ncbi:MAG TPA: hypothetical protein PKD18_18800 [Saprospiraceae bacterium]|jgi:hypothetical protein|nr:hypothetical protein [Saprospiraceae bacterium]
MKTLICSKINDHLIKASRIVAITSFILGTVIFLSQVLLFDPGALLVFGFIYLIIAVAINLIFALALIGDMFIRPEYKMHLLKTLGILLLNIPIAICYTAIVFNHY